ncbi:unnamed protein product, partial [Laminaria digitata]
DEYHPWREALPDSLRPVHDSRGELRPASSPDSGARCEGGAGCTGAEDAAYDQAGGVLAIRGPQRSLQDVAGVRPRGLRAHSTCREQQISGPCETGTLPCPPLTFLLIEIQEIRDKIYE